MDLGTEAVGTLILGHGLAAVDKKRTDKMAQYCAECVLSTDIPGVLLDASGLCNHCIDYKSNRLAYDSYFRPPEEFFSLLDNARALGGQYDCLLLYSGGKDSTHVLYELVNAGYRVLAYTFDNGYISKQSFINISAVCGSLGVKSIVGRLPRPHMDKIFDISLRTTSTVCWGCFRSLTRLGKDLALQYGISIVVTGLSRGQIFETKVYPLLKAGVYDVREIDAHLQEFQECYNAIGDETAAILDKSRARDIAERPVHFIDFFRYHGISKASIVQDLADRARAWQRPHNVGSCSTNCMINDLGIAAHLNDKGYHDYAISLSWDIRFGHIERSSAFADITADLDKDRLARIASKIHKSLGGAAAVGHLDE